MRLTLVLVVFALSLLACGGRGTEPVLDPVTTRPRAISVYDQGHVTRLEPGTELFGRMHEAVGKVTGHEFKRESSGSSEGYVQNVKEGTGFGDASQRALELIYPAPGLRLGDYGPHTHVFISFGQVRPEAPPLPDNTLGLNVGNGEYELTLATNAPGEVNDLLKILNLVLLRPAPGKCLCRSSTPTKEDEVFRVARDFLEALGLSRTYRENRDLSGAYERIARLHLAPQLGARTPDLGRLGLRLPRGESEFVSVGWLDRSERVRGDWATTTAVVTILTRPEGEQRVELDFKRLDDQWKVTSIRPVRSPRWIDPSPTTSQKGSGRSGP